MYDAIVKFFVIASKFLALIFPLLVDDLRASEVSPCPPKWALTIERTGTLPFGTRGSCLFLTP